MTAANAAIDPEHAPIRARATVLANEADGNGRTLRLAVPGWPGSQAGQFVMLGAGAESGVPRWDPLLPRPMAVFRDASPGRDEIEVLYRVVGRGTTLMSEMVVGQQVGLVGPLGRGFRPDAGRGGAILVGGGTGIASLYELARTLVAQGRPAMVILGARHRADLLGRAEFEALDIELVCATEDGSDGVQGLATLPLAERLAAVGGDATVFAVGPTPMMAACAALASEHTADCFVSLENPMACGFGVCLGCAAPRREGGFALVCRAGPVFDAREIDWEGLP